MLKQTSHRSSQSGFTLIEIMIALFVLSVGVLGTTALLLRGQFEARQDNYASTAAMLAQGMADRMRANIQGVYANDYDALNSHMSSPGCIASGCGSTTLVAQNDSFEWGQEMDQLLPNATGNVRGNGQNSVMRITVSWTETQKKLTGGDTVATRNYVMVFQP